MTREQMRKEVTARAELHAEERVLDALVGKNAGKDTRSKFRTQLRNGELSKKEIDVEVSESAGTGLPTFDIPGMPGAQMGMLNIGDVLGKAMGDQKKTKRMTVDDSYDVLMEEESDRLLDQDKVIRAALENVANNGIVFIDEIDKICVRSDRTGSDVSREGVQRDLLPLIEGTAVSTKHGTVSTDHILFVASGAFHLSKPSDLLPELQGRLPIRVELTALDRDDLKRILTEPENSLIRQYIALLNTENVELIFENSAIDAISDIAAEVNKSVENIGARRLHTIMEKLLEEVSFEATDRSGDTIHINKEYVENRVSDLAKDADLSKFIL